MLPNHHASMAEMIDGLASSSLNSLEYLTAVTLGLAQESCQSAAKEGESFLAVQSPWDVSVYLSMAPVHLLSDLSKRCLQLQEATRNYYEYVNSDFQLIH